MLANSTTVVNYGAFCVGVYFVIGALRYVTPKKYVYGTPCTILIRILIIFYFYLVC